MVSTQSEAKFADGIVHWRLWPFRTLWHQKSWAPSINLVSLSKFKLWLAIYVALIAAKCPIKWRFLYPGTLFFTLYPSYSIDTSVNKTLLTEAKYAECCLYSSGLLILKDSLGKPLPGVILIWTNFSLRQTNFNLVLLLNFKNEHVLSICLSTDITKSEVKLVMKTSFILLV